MIDAPHPVGRAERRSARRPDAPASLRPRLPWGRSGRHISVTPSASVADSRRMPLGQNRARDDVTDGSLAVTLVDVSRGGGGPLSNEGDGRCLHQPTRWPRLGLRTADASMDDATASVPDVPAGTQDAGTPAQGPAGISTVEYAMIYQAEKPRLVRYLIQCGANWHDADDASQRALAALYEQWETVRNPRAWLRKVAFREFIRASGSNEFPLEGHDQLLPAPSDIESLLEQDTVLSAIRQLPPLQRQVFALHFDQLTTSEIAETLQITEAAARQNLARARVQLKELPGLTRRGLTAAQDGPALGSKGRI